MKKSFELHSKNSKLFSNFDMDSIISMNLQGLYFECEDGRAKRIVVQW